MIVSHKYKYVFVEVPHTGSTAIAAELIKYYDGESILIKHSHYVDFLRQPYLEKEKYFAFAGIRNPLDEAVSVFFKFKNNHKKNFTDPNKFAVNGGFVTHKMLDRFRYIQAENQSFSQYFMRYYKLPFDNANCLSANKMDFIIRFENLTRDFNELLRRMGIDPVRPLPLINKTEEKGDFAQYYDNAEVIQRAIKVFGPFMKQWHYEFPNDWGDVRVPIKSTLQFKLLQAVRKIRNLSGYKQRV